MSRKIRYSEIFSSFQGEAEHAGLPAVWIRLFGCNLECQMFGQKSKDPKDWVHPYKDVDLSNIERVEDLPVFSTGCDSSYSWSARYKHLATDATVAEIGRKVQDELKRAYGIEKGWHHPVTGQPVMLCFTGGEPMLWQQAIIEILAWFDESPPMVTIETNGTRRLSNVFSDNIMTYCEDLHFACSPKLQNVSGEIGAVDYNVIESYASFADSGCLKFVMNNDPEAWEELDRHAKELRARVHWPMWVMPVGATKEDQERDEAATIALEAMRRGFRVATRNHCYLFGNKIGT